MRDMLPDTPSKVSIDYQLSPTSDYERNSDDVEEIRGSIARRNTIISVQATTLKEGWLSMTRGIRI
jgi:hypothetical protein